MKQHFIFFVFISIVLKSTFAISGSVSPLEHLSFRYLSSDGEIQLNCDHWKLEEKSPVIYVYCGKGQNINKEFRVHFLMRKYLSKPQGSAIELLYWVKKEEHNKTQFTGSSQTFQFSNQANIETIKIMQSIENDYAQLELSLKFP